MNLMKISAVVLVLLLSSSVLTQSKSKLIGANPYSILQSSSEELTASPIQRLAVVETAEGSGGRPLSVNIKNLTTDTITVTYSRKCDTCSDGKTYSFTVTINPRGRYFVGYHCNTGTYTATCSTYIRTWIDSASRKS